MFYYISHKLRGGQFMGNKITQNKTEFGSLEMGVDVETLLKLAKMDRYLWIW